MTIKIDNLNVEIENKKILNNINLEIKHGEIVLILGPNGHGKSTLLKTIMKHYDPKISSGDIKINNESILNLDTSEIASKFKVYFAMQNPVEIPGLTMIELLRNELNQTNEKLSVIELYKVVNKKMKELKLDSLLLNRSINNNFSGGEKKKSEILQLEIMNPDIILLDEIDSGLDVDATNSIIESLEKQQERNKTIIYISHNEKLLEKIKPNKVVLIMNGQIVEVGDFELAKQINEIGYKKYADSKGIELIENDEFLHNTIKGYSCNGK